MATSPTRTLGRNGPAVSAIGFGAGGFGGFYGQTGTSEALEVLTYAADRGVTFWDTSDYYGSSEEIIGEWFAKTGRREEIFLCSKFGAADLREGPGKGQVCSEPAYVAQALKRSLKALRTDHIDLYYQHRVDPAVPIEVVLETLRPFVDNGTVRWLGLSECSAAVLRRAKAVPGVGAKVVAVQMEYSPFEREIETNGLVDAAKELGVAVVAYSPQPARARAHHGESPDDLAADDVRRRLPRFSAENFPKNIALVDGFKALGVKYGATPGQMALAWVLAQHPSFIPIPGVKAVARLEENAHGAEITLAPEDLAALNKLVDEADVHGERHALIPQGDCIELADWKH